MLNVRGSEWLLHVNLMRLKEGSCLSPPLPQITPQLPPCSAMHARLARSVCFTCRHFHYQTFISLSLPPQALTARGEASLQGWDWACGVLAVAPGRVIGFLKGGVWRDYSVLLGVSQPGDSYCGQSLWSQWDSKACKSAWNLSFS